MVDSFNRKVKPSTVMAALIRPALPPQPLASSPRLPVFPSSSPRLLRARQGALSGIMNWTQEVVRDVCEFVSLWSQVLNPVYPDPEKYFFK